MESEESVNLNIGQKKFPKLKNREKKLEKNNEESLRKCGII